MYMTYATQIFSVRADHKMKPPSKTEQPKKI